MRGYFQYEVALGGGRGTLKEDLAFEASHWTVFEVKERGRKVFKILDFVKDEIIVIISQPKIEHASQLLL